MTPKLTNHTIAVYSLGDLGGDHTKQHLEDIAVRCFEISPGQFSWVKYKRRIDREKARMALIDASRDRYGALVVQISEKSPLYWQLTQSGTEWFIENHEMLAQLLERPLPALNRREARELLGILRASELYDEWTSTGKVGYNPYAFCDLIGAPPDQKPSVLRQKFATLRNQVQLLNDERDLGRFMDALQAQHAQLLGAENAPGKSRRT